jgi:broad specificity phosphatase PhoE
MIRLARAALIAMALACSWAVPAAAAETVYVIRHLQKEAGDDPALTAEGASGAAALASILSDAGIQAVFSTPTRRTVQTATPLAVILGLPVTRYDAANVPALIEAARAIPGNILVVGHSNTVPDLVAAFGGEQPPAMTEQDYGTIFVVTPGTAEVKQIILPAQPKAN